MRKLSHLLPGLLFGLGLATACGGGGTPATPPPAITTQPVGTTVLEGAQASFSVVAAGTPTYQWRRGGTAIPGATSAEYVLDAAAVADDQATFSVVVTGPGGSTTSADAVLRVAVAPTLTAQPTDTTVAAGADVTLSVAATANGTLAYQWQLWGNDLPGATSATLALHGVSAADLGSYACSVTNTLNGVASNASSNSAYLVVVVPPQILTQPASATVFAGDVLSLSVGALVDGNLPYAPTYQWTKDGAVLPDATGASYFVPSVTSADAGAYACVVTNSYTDGGGTTVQLPTTSDSATVTVQRSPAIVAQPGNRSVMVGQPATFSVVAKGEAPLAYQWTKNGTNVAGATAASYTVTPGAVAGNNGAVYRCVVSNGNVPAVTSDAATLTVKAFATTFQASATTISAGEGVVLTYLFPAGRTATLQTNGNLPADPVSSGGSTVVYPTVDTTYTLALSSGTNPAPIHVAVKTFTPTGFYVANSGSDDVSAYAVDATQTFPFGPPADPTTPAGREPIHLAASPSGNRLYVSNHGDATVSAYAVGAGGALTAVGSPFPLSAGFTAPWAGAVDPTGTRLYVACAEGVDGFTIGAGGALTPAPALRAAIPGRQEGDLLIHPSGRFLYVADAGHDLVKAFAIDATTGALTFAGEAPTAQHPRGLTLDRAGTMLFTRGANPQPTYVASIDGFKLDPWSGQPTASTTWTGYGTSALYGMDLPYVPGRDGFHGLAFSRKPGVDLVYDAYLDSPVSLNMGVSFSAYVVDVPGGTVTGEFVDTSTTAMGSPYGIGADIFWPVGASLAVDRSGTVLALTTSLEFDRLFGWISDGMGSLTPASDQSTYPQQSSPTGSAPAHGVFIGTLQ